MSTRRMVSLSSGPLTGTRAHHVEGHLQFRGDQVSASRSLPWRMIRENLYEKLYGSQTGRIWDDFGHPWFQLRLSGRASGGSLHAGRLLGP